MSFTIHVAPDLELRMRSPEDAQKIFELVDKNRVHLREWLGWVDVNTKVEDTEKFILTCASEYDKGEGADFGIWYKGEWVGSCGFHYIKMEHKKAEIGYWLGKEFEGNGIVTRCVNALLEYGFNTLNLNRIVIRAGVKNTKSRAIAERLGFTLEGIARDDEYLYDHYHDMAVYGLLKREWKKS